MSLQPILDAAISHAMASGYFESVNFHEPKSKPRNGLTCALWIDHIGPAQGGSGLNSTTARLVVNVRVYQPMLMEPQDAIDPNVLNAVDGLMAAYSGDFELGGLIREVDLLGEFGVPLSAQAGYVKPDTLICRVMTITLPLIVNDLWSQSP